MNPLSNDRVSSLFVLKIKYDIHRKHIISSQAILYSYFYAIATVSDDKCVWCKKRTTLLPGKKYCEKCNRANRKECAHCHRPMEQRFFRRSERICNACFGKQERLRERRRLARTQAGTYFAFHCYSYIIHSGQLANYAQLYYPNYQTDLYIFICMQTTNVVEVVQRRYLAYNMPYRIQQETRN